MTLSNISRGDQIAFCTSCGKEMPEEATFCPNCGCPLNAEGPYHNQDQRNGGNRNWNAPFYQQKDTGITIVLGVLLGLFGIMGVGQMYVGKAVRGIAILLGGFCIVVLSYVAIVSYILSDIWYDDVYYESGLEGLIVIGIVITAVHFAYFIWQAYDAHKLAKRYNEELYRTGRPPW
ncbi:MAG: zinc-ribbon domain-containing protein [Candidatus Methanoplasma sp.]|nr:zinc-ribbon domain-containing protein [Candidatus Methanoplasma sp.]